MAAQSRLHAVALQRQQRASQSSQSHITRYVIFKSSLSLCRAFSFDIFHCHFPLSISLLPLWPQPLVSGLLLMRRHNETIKCTKLGYSRSRAAQCHANAVSKVNTS